MIEIKFKIGKPNEFTFEEKNEFLKLLKKQNKVLNPSIEKIERCVLLCLAIVNSEIVSIGAIKPNTVSDFDTTKANLYEFRNEFNIELGYCYTLPIQTKKGFSTMIVKLLLDKYTKTNLMASTELRSDNPMIKILEKYNFKQYGKSWKSSIHNGALGLFLKFVENSSS